MSALLAERQTLGESGEKMSAEREGELNVYLTDRGDEERIRNPEINEDVKQPLIRLSLQTGNFTLASVSSLCVCVWPTCVHVAFVFLQGVFTLESLPTALRLTDEPTISFTRLFMLLKTVTRKHNFTLKSTWNTSPIHIAPVMWCISKWNRILWI